MRMLCVLVVAAVLMRHANAAFWKKSEPPPAPFILDDRVLHGERRADRPVMRPARKGANCAERGQALGPFPRRTRWRGADKRRKVSVTPLSGTRNPVGAPARAGPAARAVQATRRRPMFALHYICLGA